MNLVCRYIYISRHDDEEDDKEVDEGVGGAAELAWGGGRFSNLCFRILVRQKRSYTYLSFHETSLFLYKAS